VMVVVDKIREAKSMGTRECQIRLLAQVAPRGDERAISAVCEVLTDFKSHSVAVREAAVESLAEMLSDTRGSGDMVAFQCLLNTVTQDSAHTVRRAAFELIPTVAVGPQERAALLELAMPFLTREDLRGQPLFKPNGDPMSLCSEAIGAVGKCAARGDVGVWALLERRVVDDAASSARVAAVKALACVADGNILSSGGRRSTIHLLAVGARDTNPAMARACRETLGELITAEGATMYWG